MSDGGADVCSSDRAMIEGQVDMRVVSFDGGQAREEPEPREGRDGRHSNGLTTAPRPPLFGAVRQSAEALPAIMGKAQPRRRKPDAPAMPFEKRCPEPMPER